MDIELINENNIVQLIQGYMTEGSTLLEALVEFSEQNDLDETMLAGMIRSNEVLFSTLKSEAQSFHLLKKEESSPTLLDF